MAEDLSDDQDELEQVARHRLNESADRPHVKRRKTFQDWVTTVGGMVAIIGAFATGISFVLGVMPFVRTDLYAADMIRLKEKDAQFETQGKETKEAIVTIQRNGLLTLQLQLKSRIDLLQVTLKQMPQSSPSYIGILSEINGAQQQLDEISRQLNR